jgi:glutaredoxin
MARYFLFAVALSISGFAHADVYKWKDADGRVQFGDRSSNTSAEKMRIHSYPQGSAEVTETNAARGDVVMYSASWCGVCKRARQYMVSKGIPFTEHDVEKSDIGRSDYKKLNGRGVPIILVGDKRMNGFSAASLERMMEQAGR